MKTRFALVGLALGCFLSGCAHDRPAAASKSVNVLATGTNATFRVEAAGSAPLTYQWSFNCTNVSTVVTNR
jgi:uncharacterized lipoprotein YbaY